MAGELKEAGLKLKVQGMEEFQQKLKEASKALNQNQAEMKKLSEEYGKGTHNADFLLKKQSLLTKQLENQKKRTEALQAQLAKYRTQEHASEDRIAQMQLQITKSEAFEARYARQIRETGEALDAVGQEFNEAALNAEETGEAVKKVSQEFKELEQDVQKAGSKLDRFSASAIDKGKKISAIGGRVSRGVTLPIIGAFTYAGKEAIEFEKAYSSVIKTVDADERTLKRLKGQVKELSASGFVTQTKEEISETAAAAGQLGIQVKNIMGFTKSTLQLKDATNLGTDAAEQLAQFANITGMSQEYFGNLGSAIVDLGNNSATQEDKIMNMAMRIAAAGRMAKMHVSSIVGLSAAFASTGMEAEAGGTAVSKAIVNIDTAVAKGGKHVQKYAKIANMSVNEFTKLWKSDSAKGFAGFIQGLRRISESGGNVAIELEKIGIKDQRMRDAMMRAVNAGDLLAASIERGNKAFHENTSLEKEANKKMGSRAARLKVLKNRFDNAASDFGESLFPVLDSGMQTVDRLVKRFSALSEEQRKNIIQTGLWIAGVGPAIKVVGSLTQALGYVAKAFGFLSSTGLWIPALGIAGFSALALAILNAKNPLQQIEEKMRNLKFDIDENSLEKTLEGIQSGIDAGNREYTIRIGVKAEMDAVESSVGESLVDGKLNYKERNSLKKQLDRLIKADIDAAQKELAVSVEKYKRTLDALKSDDGEDLFTKEEKESLLSGVTQKTQKLTEELRAYQSEYNILLETIYKAKKPATDQQMRDLENLLSKISSVRSEIKAAQDEAVQAARAQYNLTVEGRGDEQTLGVAIGYAQGQKEKALQEIESEKEKMLASIEGSAVTGEEKINATEKIIESSAKKVKIEEETHAKNISSIIEGVAKNNKELADALKDASENYEKILKLREMLESGEGVNREGLRSVIGEELFQNIFPDSGYKSFEDVFDKDGPAALFAVEALEKLSAEMAKDAESLAVKNPFTALLKSMMEKGVEIDPAFADGILKDIISILDFADREEEFGIKISENIKEGMNSKSALNAIQDSAKSLKKSVDAGMGDIGAAGYAKGESYISGMLAALKGGAGRISAAASGLLGNANAVVPRADVPKNVVFDYSFGIPGAFSQSLANARKGGEIRNAGNVQNVDNSVHVNIQNANVKKESDIRALAMEIKGQAKRNNASYGTIG